MAIRAARSLLVVALGLLLISSCAAREQTEVVLSKQFNVCIDTPKESTSEIKKPVDVEFAIAKIGRFDVRYVFDNYPRKKTFTEAAENGSPMVSEDLKTRLLERAKRKSGEEYAYVRFDQNPGAKFPYAYAEITSSNAHGPEFMKLVEMMRRCRVVSD